MGSNEGVLDGVVLGIDGDCNEGLGTVLGFELGQSMVLLKILTMVCLLVGYLAQMKGQMMAL